MGQERVVELERENERLRREVERLRAQLATPAGGLVGDLETVIHGLPLLVFLFDAEDRYLDYRAGRAADLYAPPESFLGRRIDEVMPEPLGGRFRAAMARARTERTEELVEYSLDTPSGSHRFEARIVSLARGRVAILVTDVTDHWRTEEALRASEERFRALTERATDVLVLLDAEGRVVHWSTGATEALGWTAEERLARPGMEIVHPDDAEAAGRTLEGLARSPGAVVPVVLRARHRDGSWRTLDAVSRSLLHVPAVRGIVVNARDVTHQRQLEQQVQASQRLESIGRLAGGVAHDFNNLLTVILSCAEALGHDLGEGHPSAEDVREIRGAGERARDLTRQLLAFARRQVIAPVVLDLNALLRDSEKLLRRVLGEDVDIAVELSPDLWPVRCDPAQIQQVILNLAVNARDAMPRGGKLTIETANLVLDETYAATHQGIVPGPHVLVAVSDSGEGMTPEARAHLFEPFFTTKPAGHGTGLGLATVYGIVRQSGGHVWVYSEPGRGTTFKVYFPRTEPGLPAAAPAPRPVRSAGGDETVLVVEDDPRVREVTVKALRGAGYRVLAAGDGREALAVAAASEVPVDLLVTDVVMPELSGKQVAEELGARMPGLRVLFVSGYTQNTIVHHGVLDAGVEFLAKPFTPTALLARVREVLERG
ncbi:MAG TPA: ATP-binding protein [Anaeromyxobacteraceae bacterium]|nr:ATP-binding protein [Anaeromyxobacteraceae bacterium]